MRKHIMKILAYPLATLVLAALWSLRPPEETTPDLSKFPRVSWGEAQSRVEAGEWLLVDAREEEHFNAQHIPGAVSLPAHSYPELLKFFAEDHGTNKMVVVYCGSDDCDLSTELATRLRDEIGWREIRILDGGFLAWRREKRD